MSGGVYSGMGLTIELPTARQRCLFCGERLTKGMTVYQFARIQAKAPVNIKYGYSCISCADKRSCSKSEQSGLTEAQTRQVWDGVEALESLVVLKGEKRYERTNQI